MHGNRQGSKTRGLLLFVIGIIILYAGILLDAQLRNQYSSLLPYLVPDSVIVITAGFFVALAGLLLTFYGMVVMGRD